MLTRAPPPPPPSLSLSLSLSLPPKKKKTLGAGLLHGRRQAMAAKFGSREVRVVAP